MAFITAVWSTIIQPKRNNRELTIARLIQIGAGN